LKIAPTNWTAAAPFFGVSIAWVLLTTASSYSAENKPSAEVKPALPAQPIISRSGQFFVYSPDDNWSVRFVAHADAVRAFVLDQLGVTGAGSPIVIIIHDQNIASELCGTAQLTVRPVQGAQTYLILNLHLPMRGDEMLKGLIEAVALEAIHRGKRWSANAPLRRAPLWWIEGAAETFREDLHESHQQMLARVWSESSPTQAAKILGTAELPSEPMEQVYFVAQCGVLFRGIADLAEGPELMRDILRRSYEGESASDSFRKTTAEIFPDDRTLEKWWALKCAAHSNLTSAGFMSAEDSLLSLRRLLLFNLTKREKDSDKPAQPVSLSLAQLAGHHRQPDVRVLIRDRSTRLRLFATQTHPYFKPASLRFAEALELLHAGQLRAFREKLAEAEQWLAEAESYNRRARLWMNEVETELRPDSGRLLPFIEAIGRGREFDRQRTNQIKKFMDDVEREMSK
jgi:hypothetical protein